MKYGAMMHHFLKRFCASILADASLFSVNRFNIGLRERSERMLAEMVSG